MKINFKNLIPHIIAVVTFMLLSVLYFSPQMEGKVLMMGDVVSNKSMGHEVRTYKEETGNHSYWTNSMFGGMPAYQIVSHQEKNVAKYFEKALMLGFSRPIGYFIYAMIAFYILLIALGVNPWLSILGAVAFAFSSNNLILFEAGHATKLRAIFAMPILIAGVIKAYKDQWFTGTALFTVGMALSIYANHIQMTYYIALSMIIFVLVQLYSDYKSDRLQQFLKASGFLVVGLLIAIGTGSSNLLTTYEYSKDTMRGEPILSKSSAALNSSSQVEGLDWDYAMAWSNGTIDVFSSFIPMAAGGANGYKLSSDSNVAKDLKRKGVNTRKGIQAPIYYGALPFTSGPIYFGAVMLLLCLFSFFVIPKNWRIWIGASLLLYFAFSMGKNMAFINKLFFDYAPLFNKFRTPNSVLSVSALFVPLAAIYGLWQLSKEEDKTKWLKPLYISTGVLSLIALVFAFVPSLFTDFTNAGDSVYEQRGYNINAIMADRAELLRSSSLRTLALVLATAAALYFWIKNKLDFKVLMGTLAVLVLFDQMLVNVKYLSKSDFVSKRQYQAYFKPSPVDDEIKRDVDPHYRVLDLTSDLVNSAARSYHHKTIGGYHPAKLQRYQDVIDKHISQGNQRVLDMLNMKYYIVGDQQSGKERVQRNPAALGNAWFVNNVNFVSSPDDEIDGLNNLEPRTTAVVHDEFKSKISANYNGAGSIKLTSYAPDKLSYQSTSDSDQLAVFSEVWYGPDKGWKVKIDGNEVEHIRANYILRALEIPAGNHEIEFSFEPDVVKSGNMLSLVSSLLLLALIGFSVFKSVKED